MPPGAPAPGTFACKNWHAQGERGDILIWDILDAAKAQEEIQETRGDAWQHKATAYNGERVLVYSRGEDASRLGWQDGKAVITSASEILKEEYWVLLDDGNKGKF